MRSPQSGRLSLAVLACTALLALHPRAASAQPLIVLDAGHGGSDPGAVGCSIEESAAVLDVTLRLRTVLEAAGLSIGLTRDADEDVGLSARAEFANAMGADGFVSVHSNANAGTPATGTETWIANAAGARSLSLATQLQDEMVMAWGLRDRGVRRADFVVVRDTTMPAALTELAFTNNCALDATLLASAERRQEMAEAQARAILAWLGVEPGTAGTLRGVVFEDQGVGTMDLSVRLPGARVRVVETAATAVAGGTDAAWSFMLPAGTYTVEASLDGHVTATRSCEVTSGGTTWCSVGLFPVETMTPDAAVEAPDASSTADAGRPDSDAGRIPRDGAIVGAADTGPGAQPSGCACSAAARRGPDGGSLAMLVLVVSGCLSRARRRRVAEAAASRPACATGLALTGWTLAGWALSTSGLALGGSGCATEANAPGEVALTREEPASQPRVTTLEGAPVRVTGERELLLAGPDGARLGAPFVSPDARTIVVAPSDASALYAWDRGTESLVLLCASRHCGHEPRFFGERSVATRTPEQSSSAIPGDAFTLDGQPTTVRLGARARSGEVGLAWIEDETRVLVRIAAAARTLEDGGDRFVRAELSPDARFVAVTGLTGGIALHRLSDGARIELGAGGHAHFDPEGRALVFDRTTDDGHALLTADTYLVELAEPLVVRRLLATSRLETHPSISRIDPRGAATVALVRDGAIVLADIALD
jgi:N-acetylmuramoyl-L-alanine amidase